MVKTGHLTIWYSDRLSDNCVRGWTINIIHSWFKRGVARSRPRSLDNISVILLLSFGRLSPGDDMCKRLTWIALFNTSKVKQSW